MKHPDARLAGRERARLRLARENGYLNACCTANRPLVEAFSMWCWRLRIPMVYQERRSPRSRYGRVLLDMFTTPHALTPAGQAELNALAPTRASPHDACWDRVPRRDLDRLANTVFRAATRAGNYEPHSPKLVADIRREQPGELFAVA